MIKLKCSAQKIQNGLRPSYQRSATDYVTVFFWIWRIMSDSFPKTTWPSQLNILLFLCFQIVGQIFRSCAGPQEGRARGSPRKLSGERLQERAVENNFEFWKFLWSNSVVELRNHGSYGRLSWLDVHVLHVFQFLVHGLDVSKHALPVWFLPHSHHVFRIKERVNAGFFICDSESQLKIRQSGFCW